MALAEHTKQKPRKPHLDTVQGDSLELQVSVPNARTEKGDGGFGERR